MASLDTIFTRTLLSLVHQDVKRAFPEIKDVRKPISVTSTEMLGKKWFFVEIVTPRRERFHWEDSAFDAFEAKAKAWNAFIRAYAPDYETAEG